MSNTVIIAVGLLVIAGIMVFLIRTVTGSKNKGIVESVHDDVKKEPEKVDKSRAIVKKRSKKSSNRKQRILSDAGLVDTSDSYNASEDQAAAIEFIDETFEIGSDDSVSEFEYNEDDTTEDVVFGDLFNAEALEGSIEFIEELFKVDKDDYEEDEDNFSSQQAQYSKPVKLADTLTKMRSYVHSLNGSAGSNDEVSVGYASGSVPEVTVNDGKVELRPYRVYVNGLYRPWDKRAEVRTGKNSDVEIEFGVTLKIPKGYKAVITPAKDLESKYAVRFAAKEFVLDRMSQGVPLYLKVKSLDTGYVSASGVLFNMVLQECA